MIRPAELTRSKRSTDVLMLLGALVVMMMSAVAGHDLHRWGWIVALGVLVSWLPLTVVGRYPFPVLAWVLTLDTVHVALAAHADAATLPAATMLALYTVASQQPSRAAWTAGTVAGAAHFVAAAVVHFDLGADLLYLNWAFVATALGRLIHERRRRIAVAEQRATEAERTKQAEVDRQVTAERLRIARELHDVLAHHITVVNAQAGVAQYLLRTDPVAAETALAGIATNTRAALDELRATLGLLRTPGDGAADTRAPLPTSTDLDGLFDGFRDAGLRVALHVHGERGPLSGPADLAFYRVVQESLTNAAKHAPGAAVTVHVSWAVGQVAVTVSNPVPPRRPAASDDASSTGTGHGVLGMTERASVAGGTLDAGPTVDGGYRVALVLPLSDSVLAGGAHPQKATSP